MNLGVDRRWVRYKSCADGCLDSGPELGFMCIPGLNMIFFKCSRGSELKGRDHHLAPRRNLMERVNLFLISVNPMVAKGRFSTLAL